MIGATIREARGLGIAVLAGMIAGLVAGGVGGRIAMRLVAVASRTEAAGAITENGNVVGEITTAGTVSLIVVAGVAFGIGAGLVYGATRHWLRGLGRRRPLAFGALLLVVLGFTVIDPANRDFDRLGTPIVNVVLFGAIFVLDGVLLIWLADALERVTPGAPDVADRGVGGLVIIAFVGMAFLASALLLVGLAVTTTLALTGIAPAGTGFGNASLVLLGILAAGMLARAVAEPWRTVVLAAPLLAGALLTARAVVVVLQAGA